jgi:hypothetical protein
VSGDPLEFARVLAEAGEIGLLVDTLEGEAWELRREMAELVSDYGVKPEERAYAERIVKGLDEMFAELRELADLNQGEV